MTIWPIGFYRVVGDSMLPTYRPGDTLLGLRWLEPKPGRVVVAMVGQRPLIKRVDRIDANGIWLLGDNSSHSTDSRTFGPVSRAQIRAVIIPTKVAFKPKFL